jgi:hypothetical protein
MTASSHHNTAAPSKKRKRAGSFSSTASDASHLDWDHLTEVLWDCMRPHVQRMAAVNAAAEENSTPNTPGGRAFTMPWKAIWEQFKDLTNADVGRRSIQARGRTLISKRHKGERRHRWSSEEDDELLRAYQAVEAQCLNRGEPPVADMDDKEKTVFWDTVYNCTTVRRTKKSMRERHLILEARRNSGQSVHTSSTSGSPYLSAVQPAQAMYIEPLALSASSFVSNNNNNTMNFAAMLQPIAVKEEELRQSYTNAVLDPAAFLEIADLMAWSDEEEATAAAAAALSNNNDNNNYFCQPSVVPNYQFGFNNDELRFDDFVANTMSAPQQLTC